MTKIQLLLVMLVLSAVSAGYAFADDFYVLKDGFGNPMITEVPDAYGWVTDQGPFKSSDAAKRAAMVGTDPNPLTYRKTPLTLSRVTTTLPDERYFTSKDSFGYTDVITGRSGIGWYTADGPFMSADAAYRAAGVDPSAYGQVRLFPLTQANAAVPGAEPPHFVIRDQHGQTDFVSGFSPGIGWTRVAGPFDTIDQAQRASGTGYMPNPTNKPALPISKADSRAVAFTD